MGLQDLTGLESAVSAQSSSLSDRTQAPKAGINWVWPEVTEHESRELASGAGGRDEGLSGGSQ